MGAASGLFLVGYGVLAGRRAWRGEAEVLRDLSLRQAFVKIHLTQHLISERICAITKLLRFAVRAARNAQALHLLANGWNGHAKPSGDLLQRLALIPVEVV